MPLASAELFVIPSVVEGPGRAGGSIIVPPSPQVLDFARDDTKNDNLRLTTDNRQPSNPATQLLSSPPHEGTAARTNQRQSAGGRLPFLRHPRRTAHGPQ